MSDTWEMMGIYWSWPLLNNKHYLCIVDYHINVPIMKQVEGFIADNLIKTCTNICADTDSLAE